MPSGYICLDVFNNSLVDDVTIRNTRIRVKFLQSEFAWNVVQLAFLIFNPTNTCGTWGEGSGVEKKRKWMGK